MKIANTLIREMATHGDAEELSYYKFMEKKGETGLVEHNKGSHLSSSLLSRLITA
jgi:hypothetical protein